MKRVLGWALVVLALGFVLGVWSGVRAHQASASVMVPLGLAIVMGANLILVLWLWYRARPGSGDAVFIPPVAMLSASMLVGILPGLFWPAAESVRIAGSIASLILTAVSIGMMVQRRRSLRRGGRPA